MQIYVNKSEYPFARQKFRRTYGTEAVFSAAFV